MVGGSLTPRPVALMLCAGWLVVRLTISVDGLVLVGAAEGDLRGGDRDHSGGRGPPLYPPSVRSRAVVHTYASVCANSHASVSCLSLPSSSAIGRQITDVVTSGGQSSTKFVLRTIGACARRGGFAVPVTLTVS
jgi:hypothetical protein